VLSFHSLQSYVTDGTIAMLCSVLLFIIPARNPPPSERELAAAAAAAAATATTTSAEAAELGEVSSPSGKADIPAAIAAAVAIDPFAPTPTGTTMAERRMSVLVPEPPARPVGLGAFLTPDISEISINNLERSAAPPKHHIPPLPPSPLPVLPTFQSPHAQLMLRALPVAASLTLIKPSRYKLGYDTITGKHWYHAEMAEEKGNCS